MSNEFVREERYIVFKVLDVERYLTQADQEYLSMMKHEIDAGRDCANKPPFKGLIVEADWPEYEPTWKAIEARVMGTQPAPSVPVKDLAKNPAKCGELLRELDAIALNVCHHEFGLPIHDDWARARMCDAIYRWAAEETSNG